MEDASPGGREAKLAVRRVAFIERVLQTGGPDYNDLVQEIRKGGPQWLLALAKTASRIQPVHAELTRALLGFEWKSQDALSRQACSEVLVNLASVHAEFLKPIFLRLVKNLNSRIAPAAETQNVEERKALNGDSNNPEDQVPLKGPNAMRVADIPINGSANEVDPDSKEYESMHKILHTTIGKILRIRPTAGTILVPILVRLFPQQSDSSIQQRLFVKNLLRITEYAPHLREEILVLLVERLVSLDVAAHHNPESGFGAEISKNFCDVETDCQHMSIDKKPLEAKMLSHKDQDDGGKLDMESDDAGEVGRKAVIADSKEAEEKLSALAKLNSMMEIVMQYLKIVVDQGTIALEVFRALLNAFARSILKSSGTRCVQHLLFFICNEDNKFAEKFLWFLMARIANISLSNDERRAAAAYLGGFIVRSGRIRQVTCLNFFNQLLRFALHYHRSYATNGGSDSRSAFQARERVSAEDGAPHLVFYSVCQSVFYIFCHRHKIFAAQQRESGEQLVDLSLDVLVGSELNPLRYIAPKISILISEWLAKLKIADCRKVLQYNAQFPSLHWQDVSKLRFVLGNAKHPKPHLESNSTTDTNEGGYGKGMRSDRKEVKDGKRIETAAQRILWKLAYFPFDPCPLVSTQGYLAPVYRSDKDIENEPPSSSPLLSPGRASVIQSPFTAASNSPFTLSPASLEALSAKPSPSPTHNGKLGPTPPSSQSLPASQSPFLTGRGGFLPTIALPPSANTKPPTVMRAMRSGVLWMPAAVSTHLVQSGDSKETQLRIHKKAGKARKKQSREVGHQSGAPPSQLVSSQAPQQPPMEKETLVLWANAGSLDSEHTSRSLDMIGKFRNPSMSPQVSSTGMPPRSASSRVRIPNRQRVPRTPQHRARSASEGSDVEQFSLSFG